MNRSQGYIFLCSNSTEDECLQRKLFGGRVSYQSQVKKVNKGDTLFLYNYRAGRLHGVFSATSESAMDIVPEAWEGQYPWQVRIDRLNEYPYLTRSDFEDLLTFKKGMPTASLPPEQLEKLLARFKSPRRLPQQEKDYRDENQAKIWTSDGHKVRSLAEEAIDDWLFSHYIVHGYEKYITQKDEYLCDFFIPTKDHEFIFIEYWGFQEKKYLQRKENKLKTYRLNKFKLIELFPKDLENLDRVLSDKLKHFGIIVS